MNRFKSVKYRAAVRRPRVAVTFVLLALIAQACGGGGNEQSIFAGPESPRLIFAYPLSGQMDVPTGARYYFKFSAPVDPGVSLALVDESDNPAAGVFEASAISPFVITYKPAGLLPSTRYHLLQDGVRVSSFTTRGVAHDNGGGLQVLEINPDGIGKPFMDFSTLRILFSEKVNPRTVKLAESFLFQDGMGNNVPGRLILRGRHLTFDPVMDLNPGQSYTLTLTSVIQDYSGESLTSKTYILTPRSSMPRATQVMDVSPSYKDQGFSEHMPYSDLSATGVNTISLSSPLIGDNKIRVDGALKAELADAGQFPTMLPIVIRKNSRLFSSALKVKLGGKVPAGLETQDITITLLSDASGYIMGNPYGDSNGAPVVVSLVMDIAMNSADQTANSAINQDVLHVKAIGTVKSSGKGLIIDVVGSLEMDLLGIETATGNLVFHMTTPDAPPMINADATPPVISSVYPQVNADDFPRDGDLLVHFSEVLDPDSIAPGVNLVLTDRDSGNTLPLEASLDGSTLVLAPETLLTSGGNYKLSIGAGIKDVAGNYLSAPEEIEFSVPAYVTSNAHPPIVTAVYPGTPCALTGGDFASGGQTAGHCSGGLAEDDNHEVFQIDPGRSLEVYTSQPIKVDSVIMGSSCGEGSLRVERVDEAGACLEAVKGTVFIKDRNIRFVPSGDWKVGERYHLTIVAGSDTNCDAGEICGVYPTPGGRPLNTNQLADEDAGGPDLIMPFETASSASGIFTTLLGTPYTDINGNGEVDSDETKRDENRVGLVVTGRQGIIVKASIDGENRIFLNTTMLTSIGSLDEQGRIPVTIYPQAILGTSINLKTLAIIIPLTVPTHVAVMRIRAPARGYITESESGPRFSTTMNLYFDNPAIEVLGGLADVDLHSKALSMTLEGPVSFLPDGRMLITLSNTTPVDISVKISMGVLDVGHVYLQIPVGEAKIQLMGKAPKGLKGDHRL